MWESDVSFDLACKFFFIVMKINVHIMPSGIDVEEARSKEERIMLEDAQSWMNGRTINEIKDRSGEVMAQRFYF